MQSLALEHPSLNLTAILPSTIEGDFRASAVDCGPVREDNPNKKGLKREYVAEKCIEAVESGGAQSSRSIALSQRSVGG